MNRSRVLLLAFLACAAWIPGGAASAADLARLAGAPTDDPSGVARLRALDPSLTGDGVAIALVDPTAWVNPATSGQPAEKFFYVDGDTVTHTAPHKYGDHASVVSASMVGTGTGGNPAVWRNSMAPGIGRFYSYATADFMERTILGRGPLAGGVRIVSQPFGFDAPLSYEQAWDDFAARNDVLFVSSSGGGTQLPGSMHNGLVAAAGVGKLGTTRDGRVFRHLHYPAGSSSAAAGAVGGGVAVLMQAALRGDGGAGTAEAAADARTLKALILNGATKRPGWRNSDTVPLDAAQGAGMINVFNAHAQLAGGRLAPGRLAVLAGWDLRTLSSAEADAVNTYEFTLAADPKFPSITLASTIVWNRQVGQAAINHLTLELYEADGTTLVPGGTSRSPVDNLQMIHLPTIKPGTYQLRVCKPRAANQVSAEETYALAFFAAGSYVFDVADDTAWNSPIDDGLPVVTSGPGRLTVASARLAPGSLLTLELPIAAAGDDTSPTGSTALAVIDTLDLGGAAPGGIPLTIQARRDGRRRDKAHPDAGSWDGGVSHVFPGIVTCGSIDGFAPDRFAFDVDTTVFTGGGTWSVAQNGSQLDLHYTPPPKSAP